MINLRRFCCLNNETGCYDDHCACACQQCLNVARWQLKSRGAAHLDKLVRERLRLHAAADIHGGEQ